MSHHTILVDGLQTHFLEAGDGDPVVLLHGGEFGASAEIGWEKAIPALSRHYRVLAPDMLGFGESAKVVDFTDGRGMRSATSPASARFSVSTPRISSATRWGPSTC